MVGECHHHVGLKMKGPMDWIIEWITDYELRIDEGLKDG
jgi:hypothetical protein